MNSLIKQLNFLLDIPTFYIHNVRTDMKDALFIEFEYLSVIFYLTIDRQHPGFLFKLTPGVYKSERAFKNIESVLQYLKEFGFNTVESVFLVEAYFNGN